MARRSSAPKLDQDYQAESDHHTLTRAAEIHGDKARMAGVHRHHKKQTRALDKVGSMLGHGRSMHGKH